MNIKHSILVERYRPDTLKGYLCNDLLKDKIQEFIKNQDIPHLGLFGQTGSGKTTLAKILAKNIDCGCLLLNATEERGIEVIKDKVGSFASASSFKSLKIIILDEATHMLAASQVLLLNMIEQFSLKTRFILTGNYSERLIPALKSRLQSFELFSPTKSQIAEHVSNILDQEKIKYEKKDLVFIINNNFPDIRSIINSCQKYTTNNKLIINKNEIQNKNEYFNIILSELKKPSYKSFNNIRQAIADSKTTDFNNVYKELYNNLNEYGVGKEGTITCILEESIFHSNFRIDGEISIMSCISKILDVLK